MSAKIGNAILDSIAEKLIAQMRGLTDEELASLRYACRRVNSRNCWHGRYDARNSIQAFLDEELRERPIRRSQAQEDAA